MRSLNADVSDPETSSASWVWQVINNGIGGLQHPFFGGYAVARSLLDGIYHVVSMLRALLRLLEMAHLGEDKTYRDAISSRLAPITLHHLPHCTHRYHGRRASQAHPTRKCPHLMSSSRLTLLTGTLLLPYASTAGPSFTPRAST